MAKKNKKYSKKSLEDYGFGGTIESPNSALAENNIMKARAMLKADSGLTNGLDIFGNISKQVGGQLMSKGSANFDINNANGLGNFINGNKDELGMLSELLGGIFANGGIVPDNKMVEVEGDEVAELPNGQLIDFEGPTHEEGGIDTTLPVGTEVYSDRIKIKGKTMAQRKKAREKALDKAQKIYDKTGDKVAKNSLDRLIENNEKEEKADMDFQIFIDSLSKRNKDEKAYGGPILPTSKINKLASFFNNQTDELDYDVDLSKDIELGEAIIKPKKKGLIDIPIQSMNNYYTAPPAPNIEFGEIGEQEKGPGFDLSSIFGSITQGDVLGLLGNHKQVKGAKDYTLAERANNTPNQTFFDDYGKETLDKLSDMKAGFKTTLDLNNQDIERARNSAQNRNNNSARGINTLRALNIATDNAADQNKNKAYSAYMQMISGVDGKIADTNLKIDEVQALDQKQKADADQKDIAAFYQNMQTNAINEGKLMSSYGQALNKFKTDEAIRKGMESIFPNFTYDTNGNIIGKEDVDGSESFEFDTPDYSNLGVSQDSFDALKSNMTPEQDSMFEMLLNKKLVQLQLRQKQIQKTKK